MITITIPGRGDYRLSHLALDLNGTVALDGRLIQGVAERLSVLRSRLSVHVLTADTLGLVAQIEEELGLKAQRMGASREKAAFVRKLGAESVAAIGNGANDAEMLSVARLGIAVLGTEGLARATMETADIVVPGILPALDLLLNPSRLVATLRC